jgi:hypothetical protein
VDPWHELGLDVATATVADVKLARRRLVKAHHPDLAAGRGVPMTGDRLVLVNQAAEQALAEIAVRGPARAPAATPAPMPAPGPESAIWLEGEAEADATFTIPHLPVEAFELLLLAFSSIGDPKEVDEPYVIEGMVDDPFLGMARVEVVPEAGGSIVTVTTSPFRRAGNPPPTPAQVAGRLLYEVRTFDL